MSTVHDLELAIAECRRELRSEGHDDNPFIYVESGGIHYPVIEIDTSYDRAEGIVLKVRE